jgi:hypothetical protein
VRTVAIIVSDKGGENPFQMWLIQDQQPIEALGASRAYKSLRHSVRLRSPKWRPDGLYATASKYLVEAVAKLLVAVENHEPERLLAFG